MSSLVAILFSIGRDSIDTKLTTSKSIHLDVSLDASESIASFWQQEAGTYLRTIFHYENGEYERLYVRDDVAEQDSESEWDTYFSQLAAEEADETAQTESLTVGNHHAPFGWTTTH